MSGTAVTDSYIETIEDAQAYFSGDPRAKAFVALGSGMAWYLQRATKIIDSLVYQVFQLVNGQERQFPRKYIIDEDQLYPWGPANILIDAYGYGYISSDPPQDILDACCEEALAIFLYYANSGNVTRENLINSGVKSYSLGGGYSETLGAPLVNDSGLYSSQATRFLQPYLENAPFIV